MDTPRGGNNEGSGTAEEGDQADGNNDVAEDGHDDDIILEGPTMQQPQNGEGYGVTEGGPRNGHSFAGLEPDQPTLLDRHPNNRLAANNLEPAHVPLYSWNRSPNVPITDLFHLVGLQEERHRARRRTSARKKHSHKRQRRE
ncbi:hypothetical protein V493_05105 [Pseudogymnoascus sp. VKM F-4281 (FW-2241)]|nr:hypothetical protein V493_05105 [Pseudogymnoascus sp. VKM F-4281 (FW-2241)]